MDKFNMNDFDGQLKEWVTALRRVHNPLTDFLAGASDDSLTVSINGEDVTAALIPASKNQLLEKNYQNREKIETLLYKMEWVFLSDLSIESYDIARWLAWHSKRITDEIDWLKKNGAVAVDPDDAKDKFVPTPGYVSPRWTKFELEYDHGTERVARDIADAQGRDRDAVLLSIREKMKSMSVASAYESEYREAPVIDKVVGIDLETTGLTPTRAMVVNAGWERIDLHSDDDVYDAHDRYYGVTELRLKLGNPTEGISGVTAASLDGLKPLDVDEAAQAELLGVLTSAPYVAHNARFEDSFFKLNVKGYMEAERSRRISIVDSKKFSQRFDNTGGSNTLDAYAHRWGALKDDESERHLGLDDTNIMLIAMRNHLKAINFI